MNAVCCLYVTAAKVVLQANTNSHTNPNATEHIGELGHILPQLRQHFTCAVCQRLLTDPYAPPRCTHNVCRLCVGRKQLHPACTACAQIGDFKSYHENRSMRCLILCYKSLCDHVRSSPLYGLIAAQKHGVALQEIINEAASYEDMLSVFSGDLQRNVLTKLIPPLSSSSPTATAPVSMPMAIPQLPPLAAAPPSGSGAVAAAASVSQVVPKAATPPFIKQEVFSPPTPPMASLIKTTTTALPQQQQQQHSNQYLQKQQHQKSQHPYQQQQNFHQQRSLATNQTVTIKHLKSLNSGRGPNTLFVSSSSLPPGVVVPIVSSAGTTTAPLSIASAKMQSLNRQARNAAAVAAAVQQKQKQQQATPPLTFKVSLGYTVTPQASTITTTSTNTITTTSRQPTPSIKTVSNGSAMYSVLYTGIGNKITIKRKTDSEDDATQRKNSTTSVSVAMSSQATSSTTTTTTTPAPHIMPTTTNASFVTLSAVTYRQQHQRLQQTSPSTTATTTTISNAIPKSPSTSSTTSPILLAKRRGCRCGNATPTPGKLTCCGQRCPCYVESKSCVGCKCRGCRNPHRPDGGKVRPVIPELAAYGIEMADEGAPTAISGSNFGNSKEVAATSTVTMSATSQQQPQKQLMLPNATMMLAPGDNTLQHQTFEEFASAIVSAPTTGTSTSSNAIITTPTATLIPFRGLQQQIATVMSPPLPIQQHQQHHHHQQQQQQIQHTEQQQPQMQLSTGQGNMVQLENLQRESVLIQNAEGKYQVVNLFTQQRMSNANATNIANSLTSPTGVTTNTFILPQMMAHHSATTAGTILTTNSTVSTGMPQLIIQQQPQQQQHQQNNHHQTVHRFSTATTAATTSSSHTNVSGATITLHQLQQQLKQQQNIITVHPITTSSVSTVSSGSSMVSTSSVTPTITLSPIIVHTPTATPPTATNFSTDPTDMCGNSGGDSLSPMATTSPSITQQQHQLPQLVALPMDQQNHNNNNTNATITFSGGTTTTVNANGTVNNSRGPTATLMEIMDTNQVT